jgi:gamma-glutamylaminecyclotransferase
LTTVKEYIVPLFSTTYQPDPKNRGFKSRRFRVFVYGTLLKGFGNHRILEMSSTTRFIGKGTIRAKLFTQHWSYPFITLSSNNKDRVKGEMYEVDYPTLCHLNHLEGYDPRRRDNHYNRVEVVVQLRNNGFIIKKDDATFIKAAAFVYTYKLGTPGEYIASGDWRQAKDDQYAKTMNRPRVTSTTTLPNGSSTW